jgi:uncharacterized repeat protein (TIGR03803 family)
MHRNTSGRNCLIASLFWVSFSFAAHAQNVAMTPLHTFATTSSLGAAPTYVTSLLLGKVDGAIYGTTYQDQTNGTIFSMNTDGSGYAVLHSFEGEESPSPVAYGVGNGNAEPRVIQASDGLLYGTTPAGGAFGLGMVFRCNPNGSAFTVIHDCSSFDSPCNIMQGADGALYVVGTSIFRIDGNGNSYSVLYTFTNGVDGGEPFSSLLQATNGALYGTCYLGGTNSNGTLFTIQTNGSGFKVLHTFGNNDGINPLGTLIQGGDGALYGTTWASLTNSHGQAGVVYKIDTDGGNYQILHAFTTGGNDGGSPASGLVETADHMLYGTTFAGGNIGAGKQLGTVYRIGLDGDGYSTVYYFTNSSPLGQKPIAGLVKGQTQGNIGVLYGATSQGPNALVGEATVFAMLVNPPLSITPVVNQTGSNQTTLFWPQWAAKYSLQATTNPASSNWVTVTDAVPVFGAQITGTNPAMFYRLVSP